MGVLQRCRIENFSAFGRDWLRLIYEDNEWKLCHNI